MLDKLNLNLSFYLPSEINQYLFSYLTLKDLSRCCQVSKLWQERASQDILYKQLFPHLPAELGNLKSYLNQYHIMSEQKILQRVKEFSDFIPLNQKKRMIILFPFNSDVRFEIVIGYGKIKTTIQATNENNLIDKTYIFIQGINEQKLESTHYKHGPGPFIKEKLKPIKHFYNYYNSTHLLRDNLNKELDLIFKERVKDFIDEAKLKFLKQLFVVSIVAIIIIAYLTKDRIMLLEIKKTLDK